jgi:hypothetical protein
MCSAAIEGEQIKGWTLIFKRCEEQDVKTVTKVLRAFESIKSALCERCAPIMARQRNVFDNEGEIDKIIAGTASAEKADKEQATKEAREALVGEGKKRCVSCDTIMPLTCFQKDKRCLDGFKASCKLCKTKSQIVDEVIRNEVRWAGGR